MNFSDKIEADQDCLPCQHGNLFLWDMSAEMQSRLRFSGAVNGKTTETLPVGRVFQLENSADRTINQLDFSLGGETMTVIPDLSDYPVTAPEDLKCAIAVPDELPPEREPEYYYPNGSGALAAFRTQAFNSASDVQALRRSDPTEYAKLMSAFDRMNFSYNISDHPILHTSELIREIGSVQPRLKMRLRDHDLSARAQDILARRARRYQSILEAEPARREQPKGEGLFVIALKDGSPAAAMSDGPKKKDDLTPAEEVSIGDSLAEAIKVNRDAIIEAHTDTEDLADTVKSTAITGAVQTGAIWSSELGTFAADLNDAYLASISGRTARRYLTHMPSFKDWVRIHREFLREILSTDFEIKTWRGKKHIIFSGKATLRAHPTKKRYPKEGFRVIDAVSRNVQRSPWVAVKDAFTGGINRFFIALACVIEIKDWLKSEQEDWANLVSRLTIVAITTSVIAFVVVLVVGSMAAVASLPFIVGTIILAGVSFAASVGAAVVIDLFSIKYKLADFIRFAG